MKETFPGYYRPTETEFQDLWDNCLFVLDANVLLNLYQYSVATREELLSLLGELSDRLWVPHQAGLEYQRNRLKKIDELVQLYQQRRENLKTHLKEVDDQLRPGARHPFVNAELLDRMTAIVHEIDEELAEKQEECRTFLDDDPVRPDITVLLDGKVGSPYADSRQREIYNEGKQRYEERTPPGYADSNKAPAEKGPPDQYGDLVLWYQVIDEAKEQNKPVILVTDDRKEDWWEKHHGKTMGPRPKLIQEMKSKAGVSFYMYSADQFMKYARAYTQRQVKEEAIEEVRSIRELDEKHERRAKAGPLTLSPLLQAVARQTVSAEQLARMALPAEQLARMAGVPREQIARSVQELARMVRSPEDIKVFIDAAKYQKAMMDQIGLSAEHIKAFTDAVKYQKAMMDQIGLSAEHIKALTDAVNYQKAMMGGLRHLGGQAETKEASEDAIVEGSEPSSSSDGASFLGLESEEEADGDDMESESEDE